MNAFQFVPELEGVCSVLAAQLPREVVKVIGRAIGNADSALLSCQFQILVVAVGIVDAVSPDEAEQGQSTVPRMVGEAEGVAVVNRR